MATLTTNAAAPFARGISLYRGINAKLLYVLIALEIVPLVAICMAGYYLSVRVLGADSPASTQILVIDLAALALSIGAIVVVGVITGRSVTKPVLETAAIARRIGQGDLRQTVRTDGAHDELDVMVEAINGMVGYIREMAAIADRLATGDLSGAVHPRSQDDVLGVAFQQMVANIHQLTASVAVDAQDVAQATMALSRSSDQAREASRQIALAMEAVAQGSADESQRIASIAAGADEQRRNVLATSDTISQMSEAIEQVAVSAQAVAETADSAYQAATEGGNRVRQAVESMTSIREAVMQSAAQIRQLGDTSKQISAISEFIGDIAEQTNLLALNAAIEAARAGEQGRGFAVVAEEVRKLAARSASATSQISELTAKISVDTHQAMDAMERGVARVEEGSGLAVRAGDALQSILAAVRRTNDQVQNISSAAEEMTASSEEVVSAINSISKVVVQNSEATEQMSQVSKSNASVTEQISASAERLSEQVEAIYGATQQLSNLATSLQAATDSFRL